MEPQPRTKKNSLFNRHVLIPFYNPRIRRLVNSSLVNNSDRREHLQDPETFKFKTDFQKYENGVTRHRPFTFSNGFLWAADRRKKIPSNLNSTFGEKWRSRGRVIKTRARTLTVVCEASNIILIWLHEIKMLTGFTIDCRCVLKTAMKSYDDKIETSDAGAGGSAMNGCCCRGTARCLLYGGICRILAVEKWNENMIPSKSSCKKEKKNH